MSNNQIIDEVIAKMSDKLTPDQLTLLEANMIISFRGMKVEKECYDLALNARDWEWYLKRFRATKRLQNCSEGTIGQYEFTLSKLREYVPKNPQDISTDDIKYFLAMFGDRQAATTGKDISKSYLNNARNNLSSFFGWMHDEGYRSTNPVRNVPIIKTPKVMRHAYSGADMEKLKFNAHSVRDKAFLYFLDATGCRVGEAISVNRADINFDLRTILIYGQKGKAEREVCFNEETAFWLKEYLNTRTDEDPALFVKARSPHTRLTKTGAEHIVREIGKTAGVHAYPHRFRRTMITRCNRRGMQLQDIQTLAGHVNATTTQIYIDMQKEGVRAAYDRCS